MAGTVAPAGADTLRLLLGPGEESAIPSRSIRAYEFSGGRNRTVGAYQGALVGAAVGALLIGAGVYFDARSEDATIPASAIAVPAAGAVTLIGALVGAVAAPEKWDTPIVLGVGTGRRSGARGRATPTLRLGVSLPASMRR